MDLAKRVLPESKFSETLKIIRPPLFTIHQKRVSLARLDRKIVLHAGNSHRWYTHVPWLYPTSDEFIRSLERLAAICKDDTSIELIIRLKKFNNEINSEVISALLPDLGHVKLRSTSPFAEDLKSAVFVISDMSTAILEAIQNRTPVLIYSYAQRYVHIAGQTKPPTVDKRAAVYLVDREESLSEMISAIIAAHAVEPLSDLEIAPYIWQEKALTVKEMRSLLAEAP